MSIAWPAYRAHVSLHTSYQSIICLCQLIESIIPNRLVSVSVLCDHFQYKLLRYVYFFETFLYIKFGFQVKNISFAITFWIQLKFILKENNFRNNTKLLVKLASVILLSCPQFTIHVKLKQVLKSIYLLFVLKTNLLNL